MRTESQRLVKENIKVREREIAQRNPIKQNKNVPEETFNNMTTVSQKPNICFEIAPNKVEKFFSETKKSTAFEKAMERAKRNMPNFNAYKKKF